MWSTGSSVLLRMIVRGRVRWATPHTLVADDGARVALYVRVGTRGIRPHNPDREALRDFSGDWAHEPHVWHSANVLRVTPLGRAHSIDHYWSAGTGEFLCWYVNLQDPLRRSRLGFDTTDHALDLVVDPDGTPRWKDEDELARAVARGVFTTEEADAIRAEGERVLAEQPWPTGWEDWRPDPAWPVPQLPQGWEVV